MSIGSEFKEFLAKGNVVDLAVGVVIGAAFGKIVSSLVDDVVMPPIGMALGRVNFNELKLVLQPADAATKTAEVAIKYGNFINVIFAFVIIALVVFLVVKGINSMRRAEPAAAPAGPTADQALLTEIRDLLKK